MKCSRVRLYYVNYSQESVNHYIRTQVYKTRNDFNFKFFFCELNYKNNLKNFLANYFPHPSQLYILNYFFIFYNKLIYQYTWYMDLSCCNKPSGQYFDPYFYMNLTN